MKIPVNAPACPQCKRTMRWHCGSGRCAWYYCGVCAIVTAKKTGRSIHLFGNTVTVEEDPHGT